MPPNVKRLEARHLPFVLCGLPNLSLEFSIALMPAIAALIASVLLR